MLEVAHEGTALFSIPSDETFTNGGVNHIVFQARPAEGRELGTTPFTGHRAQFFAPLFMDMAQDNEVYRYLDGDKPYLFFRSQDGLSDGFIIEENEDQLTGPVMEFRKAGGSTASQSLTSNDNWYGVLKFRGYDGSGWHDAVRLEAKADGTPANNDMGGQFIVMTTDDGASASTNRFIVRSDGKVVVTNTAGMFVDSTIAADDPTADQHVVTKSYADANYSGSGGGTIITNHFLVYGSGNQTVTNSVFTRPDMDTAEKDVDGAYNLAADTITWSGVGWFDLEGYTSIDDLDDSKRLMMYLSKNGTQVRIGARIYSQGTGEILPVAFSFHEYNNSATNVWNLEVWHNETAAQSLLSSSGKELWVKGKLMLD